MADSEKTDSANELRCCGKRFTRQWNFRRHRREVHGADVQALVCPRCGKSFKRKNDMLRHPCKTAAEEPAQKTSTSPTPNNPPQKNKASGSRLLREVAQNLTPEEERVVRSNWGAIRTHSRPGRTQSAFVHRWDLSSGDVCPPDWDASLMNLFHAQNKRFKINYSHSMLLKDKETSELSFFHGSVNNHAALTAPVLINSKRDFLNFLQLLTNKNHLSDLQLDRPNSKVAVEKILATTFYLNHLEDFPIGCHFGPLPVFLSKNQHLHTLCRHPSKKTAYRDGLCFFRCLALHRGSRLGDLEKPCVDLFRTWYGVDPPADFSGVTMGQLEGLEDVFDVNIDVFRFDESQSPPCPVPDRRSAYNYAKTMSLIIHEDHFMYIKDIDRLCHATSCPKCGRLFDKHSNYARHSVSCDGESTKKKYPGGVYVPPQSILTDLRQYGVEVPVESNFVFPYRATFDIESYFSHEDLPSCASGNTRYTAKHVPLSVAVASNVPGYEKPVCFVNEDCDSQAMTDKLVDYLDKVSDASYSLLESKFQCVLDQLDEIEEKQKQPEAEHLNVPAESLRRRLDNYLRELPVVGFNSSNYDLNVLKPFLLHRLVIPDVVVDDADTASESLENDSCSDEKKSNPIKFVVKRNNQYLCLTTAKLRFLDISNFLAPGFSYSKYLAAFKVTEQKGFFPYDYMTSPDKLAETCLPPKAAFYSALKKCGISDEDYAACQRVWVEQDMKTLCDFLRDYNVRDVLPFLEALDKQIKMFQSLGLDLLKEGVSIPGVTLKYLFDTLPEHTFFSLFGERHKEIHELMREQIVGGPSIIFHRYHEANKTCIRGNPDKIVQGVEGYDANALYLSAIMKDMPTEHPIIRRKENNFQISCQDTRYGALARQWLEYTADKEKIHIQHEFNGKERRLGSKQLPVDGWCEKTKTCFQFHGCFFHGHACQKTLGHTVHPKTGKSLTELRDNTKENTTYLREKVGVSVREIYECEWEVILRTDKRASTFVSHHFPPAKSFSLTEDGVLKAVMDGSLFGMIQCDIHVPEALKEHFSELQPIFKNTAISRTDIGPFMKEYAEKHKLLSQPSRSLVASYFGVQVLLATPLLQWYVNHGLVVSNISLVLQYTPKPCFKAFGESVSDARRQGDSHPSKTILADTYKIIGNSSYGKTLTNMASHRDIKHVSERDACRLFNDPRYRKMTDLGNGLCEVELMKKTVTWGLPMQIGYFVYQYAKLRMLEFYYDFLVRFVSKSDFQLLEMDTDSLYLALSGPSLASVVLPEKRVEFYQEYNQWFPAQACPTHEAEFRLSGVRGEAFHPGSCCVKQQTYDKRTPGLFKTEYTGSGFVGLCSKTYFCHGDAGDKLSCKGLSKRQNELKFDTYLQVLATRESSGGTNTSFRTLGSYMYSYSQHRKSLSFFYTKRIVCDDGISTLPTSL